MADKNLAQVVAERDEARAEVERLRGQRDAANSRMLRMWERTKVAEDALARIKAIHYHVPAKMVAGPGWCHECPSQWPCPTVAALAEPAPAAVPPGVSGPDRQCACCWDGHDGDCRCVDCLTPRTVRDER